MQTCVTSPPYFGLRDYGHSDQIGLEATPEAYVAQMVEVFRLVRDALADDGTVTLPVEMLRGIDVVLSMATVRRVGVA